MPRAPANEPVPGDQAQILGKAVGVLCLVLLWLARDLPGDGLRRARRVRSGLVP